MVKFLPVLIIGIVLAIIAGGIFLATYKDSEILHRNVNSTANLTDSQGNNVGEVNTNIEADIEVTTDCGNMDCFKQKFTECKPATLTAQLMENYIYYYEIIGLKDGLCEVKSKFTAYPNPGWVGKEMTCEYDNSLDFETAVQDMSKCQGELYTLMTTAPQ